MITARVEVQDGGRTWEVELSAAGVLVGREAGTGVQSTLASTSQRHCRIDFDVSAGTWCVIDLGSTNGTFVNGGPRSNGKVLLRDGDVVRLGPPGGTELRLRVARPAVPVFVPAPPPREAQRGDELSVTRSALQQARAELAEAVEAAERARGNINAERAMLQLTENQVAELRQDVATLRGRWQESEGRSERKEAEMAVLRAARDVLEAKQVSLRQLVAELEGELAEAHQLVAAADERARVLKQENGAQQAHIEELRGVIEGQQRELARLTSELAARKG